MIPVTVFGNTYKSISAARRELNSEVPEITIRWRLKNGWDPDLAFYHLPVLPELRRSFADVRRKIDEVTT
jgi:hypothetical protein